MANINKIRLSGTTYDIQDLNAPKSVELTQAQYNALVSGGTVDPNTFYIITDATAGDLSNYYTKSETSGATEISTALASKADTATTYTKTEVDNAITAATSTKQNTLVSGTNIKTINNESILGSGNITIQGGGGKAISGGTNISVTTGETADTINCTLNISNGTGTKSIKIGDGVTASGTLSFAQGDNANASGNWSTAFGRGKSSQSYTFSANNGQAKKGFSSAFGSSIANNAYGFATGAGSNANGYSSFVSGCYTNSNNNYEAAFGNYNNSVSASTTFGDSGNTLFSVGNGTSTSARHNAFEIRQNGDIYISSGGTDIKLQDHLGGGGGGTVESAITSGSTNAVESKAIWSATTFNKGILLTFNGNNSTNYPEGCGKLVVNVGGYGRTAIDFKNNEGWYLGIIEIQNIDGINISVDTSGFDGATYEISGTTVILSYPSTGITSVQTYRPDLTYTAVVEGAWVNENTYMKSETSGATEISTALASKADTATTYTKTEVDNAITAATSTKQNTLVSGTNIKTINNESILGSGNIDIQGGSDINVVQTTGTSTTDVMSQKAVSTKLSGYVTTYSDQTIDRKKIFTYCSGSDKAIEFKQTNETAKVGFRVLNSASTNNELATFEFRPNTLRIDNVPHPLLYFGHYRNNNTANAGVPQTVIGFRQYDQKNAAAYHYLMPLPEKAKTPFSLTASFKDYYAPMGFKNGSTMITADNTGVVDLSSELGGLKLVKLTQSEYDNLSTKDNSTLYVIVN